MFDDATLLELWGTGKELTIPVQVGTKYAPRTEVAVLDFHNSTIFYVQVDWLDDGPHAAEVGILYQDPITAAWQRQPLPAQVCQLIRFRLDPAEGGINA